MGTFIGRRTAKRTAAGDTEAPYLAASADVLLKTKKVHSGQYSLSGMNFFITYLFLLYFTAVLILLAVQDTHGVYQAEHGDAGVGKYSDPHVGEAEQTHDHNNDFYSESEVYVLPGNTPC